MERTRIRNNSIKKAKKREPDWFLIFSWKKLIVIVVLWIVFVILHNLIYGLAGVDEAIFFILAIFGLPFYLLIIVAYTIVKKLSKG